MFDLLKKLYIKAETLNRQQTMKLLIVVMILFVPVGFIIGYSISGSLISSETPDANSLVPTVVEDKFYEGRISYIDPNYYPEDKISYILADSKGNEVILLKARDEKLVVSEGHFAKVYGTVGKTLDKKKDVLFVTKIVINNATN